MSKDPSYADDEVREIIERALKEQPAGGVSHQDLLSIGAGVGLSPRTVESAARQVTEARLTTAATKRVVSRRRRTLAAHAFVYLAVNALLFAINFLTTPGEWWVLFPAFFWGLALLLHAGFGLFAPISERRLISERRRLLEAASAGVARLAERRTGVRVAGPADQIEGPEDDTDAAREQRGTRGQ